MKGKFIFRKNSLTTLLALFFLVLSCLSFVGCSSNTAENEITVFSWEEYMDMGDEETEGLIEIFEKESGIKVNYRTFATNEAMYNELIKDPSACDLICPSEYMILKMREENLIQPYTMPKNYLDNGSPYIKDVFNGLGLNVSATETYAIGYMWGTMGLIYNEDKYDASDFNSWYNMLTDDRFIGKMTIKDSLRDSYILALALVYKDELMQLHSDYPDKTDPEYKAKLNAYFNDIEQETVDKAGKILSQLKNRLHSFEVDGGKVDLLTGKIDVNFAWSGDAVCAIADENRIVELGYAVPEEGSNVWFDGWVMTKSADVDRSLEFLDFLCNPANAIRNMEYIGYTSCIAGEDVFNYVSESYGEETGEEVDLKYFFNPSETTGKYVLKVSNPNGELFAQYANEETIRRCAVMNNFTDEQLERLDKMWTRVKLITLPDTVLILMVVGIVLIILGILLFVFREKIFGKISLPIKSRAERKGYKVVKVENIY